MKRLMVFVILCFMVTAFAEERKDCSPAWCTYNDLKKESVNTRDYAALANINTRIDAAIAEAKAVGSGAVYAYEILWANNLIAMDDTDAAIPHLQTAYDLAPNKEKVGIALWNATVSVADKAVRSKATGDEREKAHKYYQWCIANKALVPFWDKVEAQVMFGLKMTK